MLLFSATFEESVWRFAENIVPDPNIIRLKREEETLDTIKQFYVVCKEKEDKFTALCNLYVSLTIAQAMIFCQVSLLLNPANYTLYTWVDHLYKFRLLFNMCLNHNFISQRTNELTKPKSNFKST